MKLLESYQDALKIVGINEVEKVGKGDLIWLETPTNPKCEIFDIQKVSSPLLVHHNTNSQPLAVRRYRP